MIYEENMGWFSKMSPEKQAAFLKSEAERDAGWRAHYAEECAERERNNRRYGRTCGCGETCWCEW